MRVPHENYIRFLITSGLDSLETAEHLSELGLEKIETEYWNRQYEALFSLKFPKKIKKFWKNPSGKLPNGFFEYMNAAGLKEAWEYNCGKNKAFKIAVDIIQDVDAFLVIRALLACGSQHEEISSVINGKFAVVLPLNSVAIIEKYFFNPEIMSRVAWKSYLRTLTTEERNIIYLGIVKEGLELRAELSLPTNISVSENYQKLHVFSMSKFNQYRRAGTEDADNEAMKWAKLAMTSGDKYEKLKVSDATDFVKDIQMEFDKIDTDFPVISEDDLEEIKSNKEVGQDNDAAEPIPLEDIED